MKKDADESGKGSIPRQDDKWWLPTVRVPPNGLSDAYRKWLQNQKELVAQVLKAAMAINANILMEMEVPESYTESLPKVIYKTRLLTALPYSVYNNSNDITISSVVICLLEWEVHPWRFNVQTYNRRLF